MHYCSPNDLARERSLSLPVCKNSAFIYLTIDVFCNGGNWQQQLQIYGLDNLCSSCQPQNKSLKQIFKEFSQLVINIQEFESCNFTQVQINSSQKYYVYYQVPNKFFYFFDNMEKKNLGEYFDNHSGTGIRQIIIFANLLD